MISTPISLGIMLCEKVVIEEHTRYQTLVNTFLHLSEPTFPTGPRRFLVVAVLTDGLGDGILELVITREETGEEIYAGRAAVQFADRLRELRVRLGVSGLSFPARGIYRLTLLADGEWVGQSRLQLMQTGGGHGE